MPKTLLQYLVPQHGLSRLLGKFTNSSHPRLKNWMINTFIKRYNVDMSCALEPNPLAYRDFNQFFTRALKPEARPIVQNENAIVCPADGCISQIGNVAAGQIIQAKGFNYDVKSLLGGSIELANDFYEGKFATIYLAPKDYHRVHMPLTGKLREMIYVPGALFSVNGRTTEKVGQLFARNERVVAIFETAIGSIAVILVGAMLVASISTVWAGVVTPAKKRVIYRKHYWDEEVLLQRGGEMGRFQLGSTVILLFGKDTMEWNATIKAGQSVQLGQSLGQIKV